MAAASTAPATADPAVWGFWTELCTGTHNKSKLQAVLGHLHQQPGGHYTSRAHVSYENRCISMISYNGRLWHGTSFDGNAQRLHEMCAKGERVGVEWAESEYWGFDMVMLKTSHETFYLISQQHQKRKRKSHSCDIERILSDLLGFDVNPSDPRVLHLRQLEPKFNAVCKHNLLDGYADDVAEYLTSEAGLMRKEITRDMFAIQFAVSVDDADVIMEYVRAFFTFFEEEKAKHALIDV